MSAPYIPSHGLDATATRTKVLREKINSAYKILQDHVRPGLLEQQPYGLSAETHRMHQIAALNMMSHFADKWATAVNPGAAHDTSPSKTNYDDTIKLLASNAVVGNAIKPFFDSLQDLDDFLSKHDITHIIGPDGPMLGGFLNELKRFVTIYQAKLPPIDTTPPGGLAP